MTKQANSAKKPRKRSKKDEREVITEIVYTDKPVDIGRELLILIMDHIKNEGEEIAS